MCSQSAQGMAKPANQVGFAIHKLAEAPFVSVESPVVGAHVRVLHSCRGRTLVRHAPVGLSRAPPWHLTAAPERINGAGVVLLVHRYLIGALWLVWAGWWAIAAWRTKPVLRSEGTASRLSHVLPLALGVTLLISGRLAAAGLARRFLPDVPWTFWLGGTLVASGIAIAIWARVHLGGNWSGTVTLKRGHTLIREGPYRFVRHPIYAGLLLAVLGTAISQGAWRGLAAVALMTLAFLRKIALEERFLRARFGREYERYRAALPALIPRLPRCALRDASSRRSDH